MNRPGLRTTGRRWVGVLEAGTALAAVGGGVGLMVNGLGIPKRDAPALLGRDWRFAGLALIAVIGLGQGAAAVAELTGSRRSGAATAVAGASMTSFEVAELALIPFSWLTPTFLAVGVVEIVSAVTWQDARS